MPAFAPPYDWTALTPASNATHHASPASAISVAPPEARAFVQAATFAPPALQNIWITAPMVPPIDSPMLIPVIVCHGQDTDGMTVRRQSRREPGLSSKRKGHHAGVFEAGMVVDCSRRGPPAEVSFTLPRGLLLAESNGGATQGRYPTRIKGGERYLRDSAMRRAHRSPSSRRPVSSAESRTFAPLLNVMPQSPSPAMESHSVNSCQRANTP